MRIEAPHSLEAEPRDEKLGQVVGEGFDHRSAGRQLANVHERVGEVGVGLEVSEERAGVHRARLPTALDDAGGQTCRRAATELASACRSRASSS